MSNRVTELVVLTEGQTEERFVERTLGPYLRSKGFQRVTPKILGVAVAEVTNREGSGGQRRWDHARPIVQLHLQNTPSTLVTTMFDFFRLHKTWPGVTDNFDGMQTLEKAKHLHNRIWADVDQHIGDPAITNRFVPFVVMHEFEGLLFSDCKAFAQAINRPELASALNDIRDNDNFVTPEDINDHRSPGNRIKHLCREYRELRDSTIAASKIGIDRIRTECPNFNDWLERLENGLRQ